MIVITPESNTTVRRCPFCKIDLKGRFVYVNEQAEELFGQPQVELFGRRFREFLDPADHAAIDQITRQSSHFETVHDVAQVTIVRRDGRRVPISAIISLNFRGGTPVNYQVIIDISAATGRVAVRPLSSEQNHALDVIAGLLRSEPACPSDELAAALAHLTDAGSVTFYDCGNEGWRTVASYPAASPAEEGAGQPESGSDLSTSEELVLDYELPNPERALVRFIFPGCDDEEDMNRNRRHAETAAALLRRLWPVPKAEPSPSGLPDAVSAIVDHLPHGVLITAADGTIKQVNQTALRLLGATESPRSREDFLTLLSSRNEPSVIQTIRDSLAAQGNCDYVPELVLRVELPESHAAEMTVASLPVGEANNGALFILKEISFTSGSGALVPVTPSAIEGLKCLQASVAAASSVCTKLEHENHGELSRDGGFYLRCLRGQLHKMRRGLVDLRRYFNLIYKSEPAQTADLGLLLDSVAERAGREFPRLALSFRAHQLPKIHAELKKLEAILISACDWLIALDQADKVELHVSTECSGQNCRLAVSRVFTDVGARQLQNRIAKGCAGPESSVFAAAGIDVARDLVRCLGGSLETSADDDCRVSVRLDFPVQT